MGRTRHDLMPPDTLIPLPKVGDRIKSSYLFGPEETRVGIPGWAGYEVYCKEESSGDLEVIYVTKKKPGCATSWWHVCQRV